VEVVPPIAVAISMPSPNSIHDKGAANVAATVTNDATNAGVDWIVTCNNLGNASCGSFNPAHTASGAQAVYTAPAGIPRLNTVTIIATATADPTASRSAVVSITAVSPIMVTISTAPASLLSSATTNVAATVTNDGTNAGVDWTASCGSAGACGSFNPAHTASGAQTVYTAPASVPVGNTVTLTATSTADPTKSASSTVGILNAACNSGNEGILNGQYAFLLQGFDSTGAVAIAGSFNADGLGHVATVVGLEDISRVSGPPQTNLSINPAGSSYSVGSDNRGCLTLVNSAGTTTKFRFALGAVSGTPAVAAKGRMIEFDDTTGTGTRVVGQIRLQNPASFSNAQFAGNYAFGFSGADSTGGNFAMAGTLTSGGGGTITTGNLDSNGEGTLSTNPITSGTYSVAPSGRGTLTVLVGGKTENFAIYLVNNADLLAVTTDPIDSTHPVQSGEALGATSGPFTNSSLNGPIVYRTIGGGSIMTLGLFTADGGGSLPTIDLFQNNAGTFSTTTGSGTYSVAANGRVTIAATSVGKNPPVIYLNGQNQGFVVGMGGNAELGELESQAAGTPFGAYFFGTESPATRRVILESGVSTLGGGNGSETNDSSGPNGLSPGSVSAVTYSFASDGTGNVGSNTTAILISGNRLVFFNNVDPNPSVFVVEK
jgi:hypothetical protein